MKTSCEEVGRITFSTFTRSTAISFIRIRFLVPAAIVLLQQSFSSTQIRLLLCVLLAIQRKPRSSSCPLSPVELQSVFLRRAGKFQSRNPVWKLRMAESKPGMRKPVFTKVDQLRPGSNGHTLTVKVVDAKLIMQRGRSDGPQGRQMRIAECLVGDETGIIIFTARNEQVDLMKTGATVTLRNAKIDMFKGSMRLAVDKWGRIEVTEPADFTVKEDNNLSLIEYELVNVVEG